MAKIPAHRLLVERRTDLDPWNEPGDRDVEEPTMILALSHYGAPPKPLGIEWLGLYKDNFISPKNERGPKQAGQEAVVQFLAEMLAHRKKIGRILQAARRRKTQDVMHIEHDELYGFEREFEGHLMPAEISRGRYLTYQSDVKVFAAMRTGALAAYELRTFRKFLAVVRKHEERKVLRSVLAREGMSWVHSVTSVLNRPEVVAFQREEAQVVWELAVAVAKVFGLTYFHNPDVFDEPAQPGTIQIDVE